MAAQNAAIITMALHLDVYDAADHEEADGLERAAGGQQHAPERRREHRRQVLVVHDVEAEQQQQGQAAHQVAAELLLHRQGLDLALDANPLAHHVRDVLQHLRQVAARGALHEDAGDDDIQVFALHALVQRVERVVRGSADAHIAQQVAELFGDWRLERGGDLVDRLHQADAGLERVRHHRQAINELFDELVLAPLHREAQQDVGHDQADEPQDDRDRPQQELAHEEEDHAGAAGDREELLHAQLPAGTFDQVAELLHGADAGQRPGRAALAEAAAAPERDALHLVGGDHLHAAGAAEAPVHHLLQLFAAAAEAQNQRRDRHEHRDRREPCHRALPLAIPAAVAREHRRRDIEPRERELVGERRANAGGFHAAADLALAVDTLVLEMEDVLQGQRLALEAGHFGDVRHLAAAVAEARLLDDQVNSGGDLLADHAQRQLHARHHHQALHAGGGVTRAVGMDCADRTFVARVHRLEHVEGFAAAHLADDDAVRPHTQGVAHQIALGDFAAALDAGRPRLQRDDVRLLQAQLVGSSIVTSRS